MFCFLACCCFPPRLSSSTPLTPRPPPPFSSGSDIAHFASNWSLYTFLTWLPSYLTNHLHFKLEAAGALAILPYLAQCLVGLVGGKLCDWMIGRGYFKLRGARIFFTIVSYIIPGATLVAIGYTADHMAAVALMTVAVGVAGLSYSGYASNVLDIAPRNAGVFYGVSNTIATIPGIVSPYLTGAILGDPKTASVGSWQVVFYIAAGMYVVGTAAFCLLVQVEAVPALNGVGAAAAAKAAKAAAAAADGRTVVDFLRKDSGNQAADPFLNGATPTTAFMTAARSKEPAAQRLDNFVGDQAA